MELIKTTITIMTMYFLLITLSSATSVVDFCVADFNLPITPTGYPCKNPADVTVDDFIFSGMNIPGNTSTNIFGYSFTIVSERTLPGLNGLGLLMTRFDYGIGGAAPMHTHMNAELIIVMEGSIIAGFIASDNTAYYKTLNKGDVMVFPPSLIHFQVNIGSVPAVAFQSLNSAHQNYQSIIPSLGGNNLPTEVLEKTTLLDSQQVKKLKNVFGGTN